MVARRSAATVHGATVEDRFAERIAMAGALLLPRGVAWAALGHVRADFRPAGVVVDGAVCIVWRHPARHLIGSAVHRAGAICLCLAPVAPVVVALLLVRLVAGTSLVDGMAGLVLGQAPVWNAIRPIGRQPALLLVVAADDGARPLLRLAPAVTPSVGALVLELSVAGAPRGRWSTELLVVRIVLIAELIIAIAVAHCLVAGAVERAVAPGLLPAKGAKLVLALLLAEATVNVERVPAALRHWHAEFRAPALAHRLPLRVAGAACLVSTRVDARRGVVVQVPVQGAVRGVGRLVAVQVGTVDVAAAIAAIASGHVGRGVSVAAVTTGTRRAAFHQPLGCAAHGRGHAHFWPRWPVGTVALHLPGRVAGAAVLHFGAAVALLAIGDGPIGRVTTMEAKNLIRRAEAVSSPAVVGAAEVLVEARTKRGVGRHVGRNVGHVGAARELVDSVLQRCTRHYPACQGPQKQCPRTTGRR